MVDVFLDTPVYNGGITNVDAVWSAIPSVTLAGEKMAQRMGASVFAAAGFPEMITTTEEARAVAIWCDVLRSVRLNMPRLSERVGE